MTLAAASELHKNCVMWVVNDRIGASVGCAEVDGEVLGWPREATEAEVAAAVECEVRAYGSARDAACLPFGMVGELRRKLSPIVLLVLLLFMGVDLMDIRVSAEFPSSPACCILMAGNWKSCSGRGSELQDLQLKTKYA